ncbi:MULTISPECIES: GtrA family protein [unclassified Arthrobacter]|uniref:GtrA family protein n=1 Tax=unclassified Arthrobacter TaxID=235627 RepID=UPI0011B04CF7|nr:MULTISPECIES: GtrA family protein [unclassified Arthrobacter]
MSDKNRVLTRLMRFVGVGGFCFVVTLVVNYGLKFTVLEAHPTTAFIIANGVATIVSFVLTRQYTFQHQNDAFRKRVQAIGFFAVSLIGIGINSAPLYVSRWILGYHYPQVSFLSQEIADFVSGPIIGTVLAMVFRWWALHKFVFPDAEQNSTTGEEQELASSSSG